MSLVTRLDSYLSKQERLVKPAKFSPARASGVAEERERGHPSAGGKVRTEIYELVHRAGKTFERRRTAWVNPAVAEKLEHRKKAADWIRSLGNYIPMYFVGGFVRDKMFGKVAKDIDCVTTATLDDVKKIFDELNIEYYSASRKEETLTFKVGTMEIDITAADAEDLVADLARRDFTINSIAQNVTGSFYDPFNGLADAKAKILRSPRSNSKKAFKDDPIRILRAARFIGDYDLTPHSSVLRAIPMTKDGLSDTASERIGAELKSMMGIAKPWVALEFLKEHELLGYVAPALEKMVGFEQNHLAHDKDVWDHTMAALKAAKSNDLVLNLAILFHDIGKPETADAEKVHFLGHEDEGAKMTEDILTKLHFSSDIVKRVHNLVENHMFIPNSGTTAKAPAFRRLKLRMEEDMDNLLALARADAMGSKKKDTSHVDVVEKKLEGIKDIPTKTKSLSPLDGDELMEMLEIKPGPKVGEILNHLHEEVIEGNLSPGDKEAAEKAARQYTQGLMKEVDTMLDILELHE